MKKLNMDVSGFPMPNLSHNEFLKGKPFPGPTMLKTKEKIQEYPQPQIKDLNRSN